MNQFIIKCYCSKTKKKYLLYWIFQKTTQKQNFYVCVLSFLSWFSSLFNCFLIFSSSQLQKTIKILFKILTIYNGYWHDCMNCEKRRFAILKIFRELFLTTYRRQPQHLMVCSCICFTIKVHGHMSKEKFIKKIWKSFSFVLLFSKIVLSLFEFSNNHVIQIVIEIMVS